MASGSPCEIQSMDVLSSSRFQNDHGGAAVSNAKCSVLTPDHNVSWIEDEPESEDESKDIAVRDVDGNEKDLCAKNIAMRSLSNGVRNTAVMCRSRGVCKESFENRDAMMYHLANYHGKGTKTTYECHLCRQISPNKANLQRHLKRHTGHVRFECPIRKCPRNFTAKASLERHVNVIHTKEIAFGCSKCSMKFYRKDVLITHLANKHDGETMLR